MVKKITSVIGADGGFRNLRGSAIIRPDKKKSDNVSGASFRDYLTNAVKGKNDFHFMSAK